MNPSHWIFLSPHFDDVALSCGGLVWKLARQDHRVEIWTLMAGFPPDENFSEFARQNHLRWGLSGAEAVRVRRAEDQAACQLLGAKARHFNWPDAIYRPEPHRTQVLVSNNHDLFGKTPEPDLIDAITLSLEQEITPEMKLVFPLGLGNHIDHQAIALAGKQLDREASYYADYPYILADFGFQNAPQNDLQKSPSPLDSEALTHWQDAVLCYKSQINDFWRDEIEARLALQNYQAGGGGRLWVLPTKNQ